MMWCCVFKKNYLNEVTKNKYEKIPEVLLERSTQKKLKNKDFNRFNYLEIRICLVFGISYLEIAVFLLHIKKEFFRL